MKTADYWISNLGLEKHPEGGYFKEIYRSDELLPAASLPARYQGARAFSTSIFFLLKKGEPSRFHRLKSDEIWSYHAGDATLIYLISPDGQLSTKILGPSIEKGESLQVVIPLGFWFGAEVKEQGSYGLMGCVVAPGFEFADFELAKREGLLKQFPQHAVLIGTLT